MNRLIDSNHFSLDGNLKVAYIFTQNDASAEDF